MCRRPRRKPFATPWTSSVAGADLAAPGDAQTKTRVATRTAVHALTGARPNVRNSFNIFILAVPSSFAKLGWVICRNKTACGLPSGLFFVYRPRLFRAARRNRACRGRPRSASMPGWARPGHPSQRDRKMPKLKTNRARRSASNSTCQRQAQARAGRQAPRHDQAIQRADPRASGNDSHVGLRNPARPPLDAVLGVGRLDHVTCPRAPFSAASARKRGFSSRPKDSAAGRKNNITTANARRRPLACHTRSYTWPQGEEAEFPRRSGLQRINAAMHGFHGAHLYRFISGA